MTLIQDQRPLADRIEPRRNLTGTRWRHTILDAPLSVIEVSPIGGGTTISDADLQVETGYEAILFLNDFPAMLDVQAIVAGIAAYPQSGGGTVELGSDIPIGAFAAGVDSLFNLAWSTATVGAGQIAEVDIGGGVRVPAYLVNIFIVGTGLQNLDGDPSTVRARCKAIANGSVQDGSALFFPKFNLGNSFRGQILLALDDLTQDIVDAGWVFTDSDGNKYDVVGLFVDTARPDPPDVATVTPAP